MKCEWLTLSPSLTKGIGIINNLEESKFEQFVQRILNKIKLQDHEIFTEEELEKLQKIFNIDLESLQFSIKTIAYLFKRMLKYVFMPTDLKTDFKDIGFTIGKVDSLVKLWSIETKSCLSELGTQEDVPQFSWQLNAELSSHICKKGKTPKLYLRMSNGDKDNEVELVHTDLYSMFLQMESIQHELDNFI